MVFVILVNVIVLRKFMMVVMIIVCCGFSVFVEIEVVIVFVVLWNLLMKLNIKVYMIINIVKSNRVFIIIFCYVFFIMMVLRLLVIFW